VTKRPQYAHDVILNGGFQAFIECLYTTVLDIFKCPGDFVKDIQNRLRPCYSALATILMEQEESLLAAASAEEQLPNGGVLRVRLAAAICYLYPMSVRGYEPKIESKQWIEKLRSTHALEALTACLRLEGNAGSRREAALALAAALRGTTNPNYAPMDPLPFNAGPVSYLYDDARFSDVQLVATDDRAFYGHKVILCSSIEYFELLLTGGLEETGQDRVRVQLTGSQLEIVLRFLYSSGADAALLTEDNAAEMLAVADVLQFPALVRHCEILLRYTLRCTHASPSALETLKEVSAVAKRANAHALLRHCVTFALQPENLPSAFCVLEGAELPPLSYPSPPPKTIDGLSFGKVNPQHPLQEIWPGRE